MSPSALCRWAGIAVSYTVYRFVGAVGRRLPGTYVVDRAIQYRHRFQAVLVLAIEQIAARDQRAVEDDSSGEDI